MECCHYIFVANNRYYYTSSNAILFIAHPGLSGFIARMMIHALTLPIEFDASFSKALPLLREGNYVSQSNEKAVSSILRAAALTYVSAALADILNLSRWIVILSRRDIDF